MGAAIIIDPKQPARRQERQIRHGYPLIPSSLGPVQGPAEYLPISSSGHLEIFREILGLDLGGAESL